MRNNASLGKTSLWCSCIGIFLLVSLAVLLLVDILYLERHTRMGMGPPTPATKAAGVTLAIGGVLFVVIELVAFGCGIVARRTAAGKAGLVISGVLLPLVLGLVGFTLHIVQWSW
jgi:hypothetical protein